MSSVYQYVAIKLSKKLPLIPRRKVLCPKAILGEVCSVGHSPNVDVSQVCAVSGTHGAMSCACALCGKCVIELGLDQGVSWAVLVLPVIFSAALSQIGRTCLHFNFPIWQVRKTILTCQMF